MKEETNLEMYHCPLSIGLVLAESLQDDRVSAFAVQLDLAIG